MNEKTMKLELISKLKEQISDLHTLIAYHKTIEPNQDKVSEYTNDIAYCVSVASMMGRGYVKMLYAN